MNFRAPSCIAIVAFMGNVLPARADIQGLERVLSAVTLNFQDNGATDRAVLVDNQDGADLYIYLSLDEAKPDAPVKPALVKKGAAWSGGMWGSRPSLEISDKGSLLIKSENEAIGRFKWDQTLTVVYRNREFVVAGVTYSARHPQSGSGGRLLRPQSARRQGPPQRQAGRNEVSGGQTRGLV